MKMKDPGHGFWILGLSVLNVLKEQPWAVFKDIKMIVCTDAIENSFFFFPLAIYYWKVTLYEAGRSLLGLKIVGASA